MDCGSPLPLSRLEPTVENRQRAAAVHDAGAPLGITGSFHQLQNIEKAPLKIGAWMFSGGWS
jgi:hypothetical protein